MKRSIQIPFIILAAAILAGCGGTSTSTAGKGRIEGKVFIVDTKEPLKNALVLLQPGYLRTLTDAKGRYAFENLDPVRYKGIAYLYGHQQFGTRGDGFVRPGKTSKLDLEMVARPRSGNLYKPVEYHTAFRRGWEEAGHELENGSATIYEYGGIGSRPAELDRITGLPEKIIAGDIIDMVDEARKEGHDRRIWKYMYEHGMPAFSRLWAFDDIRDLVVYFRKCDGPKGGLPLISGGPALTSPDEEYAVGYKDSAGTRFMTVDSAGTARTFPAPGMQGDTIWLQWGPDTLDVAVVRSAGRFNRLDLRLARLSYFPRPQAAPPAIPLPEKK